TNNEIGHSARPYRTNPTLEIRTNRSKGLYLHFVFVDFFVVVVPIGGACGREDKNQAGYSAEPYYPETSWKFQGNHHGESSFHRAEQHLGNSLGLARVTTGVTYRTSPSPVEQISCSPTNG